MLEDILRNKLLANSTLAGLVGDRIFVQEAQQGVVRPYVVYTVVSLVPEYCQAGHFDNFIIQYSVFAEKYADARQIINLIRQELGDFSGTIEGLKIVSVVFESQGANFREKESRLAHISYDFRIILNK